MKLSTRAILGLVNALSLFDQQPQPGAEKPKVAYKLGAGARMIMAKNLARLNEVAVAYQKERNGLIWHYADASGQVAKENVDSFTRDDTALLDWLHDVELVTIKEDTLRLEDNDIPVYIVAGLGPMIEGMPAPMQVSFPKPSAPKLALVPAQA